VLAAVVVVAAVAGLVVWSPWSGDGSRRDGLVALNNVTDVRTDLALSPDGDILATVTYSGSVQLWNVADGQQIGEELAGGPAVEVTFSPDGEFLAVGGGGFEVDGSVRWYAVDTWREAGRIEPFDDTVGEVQFLSDGTLVTESNGIVQWWDLDTRQEAGRLRPSAPNATLWIAVSPDGGRIATSDTDNAVRLWDTATGQQVGDPMTTDCDALTTELAFSPDGATLAAGDSCGTTTLWDVATGTPTGTSFRIGDGTAQDTANDIRDVEFSPDGKALATMINDQPVRLWDVASGHAVTAPAIDRANAFAFTPDGRGMAVAEYNDRVWFYHLPD